MHYHNTSRLKDMRDDLDKTQREVAEELGLHLTTYVRWENNPYQIKLADLIELSKYYNVTIDYIAGLTNEKRPLYRKNNR